MIRALYLIYQILIALPIMIVATLLTALVTMIGSVFDHRFWGYWPGMHSWFTDSSASSSNG